MRHGSSTGAWKIYSIGSPKRSSVFVGWAAGSTRAYALNSYEQASWSPTSRQGSTVLQLEICVSGVAGVSFVDYLAQCRGDHGEAESFMRLDRIYTRGGDAGLTSLGDGTRLPKFHPRVAAMGGLDESNATIGLALLHIEDVAVRELLGIVQNDLFDVGADLARP